MTERATFRVKRGLAEMLKGGVIMDVTTAEQARISEDAGAVAVMALERVPADIRAAGEPSAVLDMVGFMRWPESAAWFTPSAEPGRNLWFLRDHLRIAEAKNWGPVAPFFIELESPQAPGGWPRAGPIKLNLPNDHLQYAMTWFGLAIVLVGVYTAWMFGRWRGRE